MRTAWSIETHGKPLETVQQLIADLWEHLEIAAMILPLKTSDGRWQIKEIAAPEFLVSANPFTPLMSENIAPRIPAFQGKYTGKKVAALLRPCEVEALYKITEKVPVDFDNLIIFTADCLGTFPSDEFAWRAERKGGKESLTEESFHFSQAGGIAPYRYRAACQLCNNPIANQADINFNIVGIPVRQQVILSTYNGLSGKIEKSTLVEHFVTPDILDTHDKVAQNLIYRNQHTKKRLSKALVENADLSLETLIDQLNACENCQACMQVCPMCTSFNFHRDENDQLNRETVINWMLSCVGCGMCEQACTKQKPLAAIFSVVNQQLLELS